MRTLRIIQPGLSSTVQDGGRPGHSAMGVGPSGAADPLSLRIGNRLLGNDESAAAIEMTLTGATIEIVGGAVLCLAGSDAPEARIEREGASRPLEAWTPTPVRAGSTVTIGPLSAGARALLCIDGGIATAPVLASRSVHAPSGIGGSALRAGDVLPLGEPRRGLLLSPLSTDARAAVRSQLRHSTLRIVPGAQHDRFGADARAQLAEASFTVSDRSDRTGLRLEGATVGSPSASMRSEGVVTGAIQIPPSGHPLVLLVDRPATGGYPVIAAVISADLPALGQLRPRDAIRFEWVDREAALIATRRQEELIGSVPLPPRAAREISQQQQQQ